MPEGTDRYPIKVTRTRCATLLREGLLKWFDGAFGDQLDHMRAKWNSSWDWSLTGKFRRLATSLS